MGWRAALRSWSVRPDLHTCLSSGTCRGKTATGGRRWASPRKSANCGILHTHIFWNRSSVGLYLMKQSCSVDHNPWKCKMECCLLISALSVLFAGSSRFDQRVASWKRSRAFSSAHCSPLTAASTSAPPPRRTSSTRLWNCSSWSSPAARSITCWWRRAVQPSLHSNRALGHQALASTRTFWPFWASRRWAWSTNTAKTTGSSETAATGTRRLTKPKA